METRAAAVLAAVLQLAAASAEWTKLSRLDHASGVPLRTEVPREAMVIARRDGAAVLTGVDMTAAGVERAALGA